MADTSQTSREDSGQDEQERVISTVAEFRQAMADYFVRNAKQDNHDTNETFVEDLLAWKRGER